MMTGNEQRYGQPGIQAPVVDIADAVDLRRIEQVGIVLDRRPVGALHADEGRMRIGIMGAVPVPLAVPPVRETAHLQRRGNPGAAGQVRDRHAAVDNPRETQFENRAMKHVHRLVERPGRLEADDEAAEGRHLHPVRVKGREVSGHRAGASAIPYPVERLRRHASRSAARCIAGLFGGAPGTVLKHSHLHRHSLKEAERP